MAILEHTDATGWIFSLFPRTKEGSGQLASLDTWQTPTQHRKLDQESKGRKQLAVKLPCPQRKPGEDRIELLGRGTVRSLL